MKCSEWGETENQEVYRNQRNNQRLFQDYFGVLLMVLLLFLLLLMMMMNRWDDLAERLD